MSAPISIWMRNSPSSRTRTHLAPLPTGNRSQMFRSDVVQSVLNAINNSIHVRPDIYMDAELPFVPDQDAPGASAYRKQIADVLHGYAVESVLHDKVIATIGETGSQFHVLVLKTNMTIPYSSVFIRLDCKYWSADAEKHMREMMNAERPPAAR